MQEWLNWQHWKCCEPVKGSVGSNPTLSVYMASGSAQGLFCEPRQTRNRATVAISPCVAVKSEASIFCQIVVMLIAKISVILTALIFLAIGIIFLVDPIYWASSLDISLPSTTAIIDLRATYGGCMFAIAVFMFYCLKDSVFLKAGLIFQIICYAGFGLSRFAGILIDGQPKPIMYYLLAAEIFGVSLGALGLRQLSKTTKI